MESRPGVVSQSWARDSLRPVAPQDRPGKLRTGKPAAARRWLHATWSRSLGLAKGAHEERIDLQDGPDPPRDEANARGSHC